MARTPKPKSFVCNYVEEGRNTQPKSCKDLPRYKSFEGKDFCVLHYPQNDKKTDFEKVLKEKFEDKSEFLNFRGIWFPTETPLERIFFEGADFKNEWTCINVGGGLASIPPGESRIFNREIDFSYCVFNGKLNLASYTFYKDLHFKHAIFNDEVIFSHTRVKNIDFSYTEFNSKVDFSFVYLDGCINFSFATLKSSLKFSEHEKYDFYAKPMEVSIVGRTPVSTPKKKKVHVKSTPHFSDKSSIIFQYAEIEIPQNILFHTINLRPIWFINVDTSKFTFTNVVWRGNKENSKPNVKDEINALKNLDISVPYPYKLLAKTCRQLAINEEENHRYEEASELRYLSMEAKRLEDFGNLDFWKLHWWYWLSSGYGERWKRAFIVLILILVTSVALYMSSESLFKDGKQGFDFWEAISYSLRVMALQRPEPQPENNFAKVVVAFQTILAPLQLALLALAVRRKFMR